MLEKQLNGFSRPMPILLCNNTGVDACTILLLAALIFCSIEVCSRQNKQQR